MKKSILIHHHCTYNSYGDVNKTVSFIANWVNELNKHFDVGLLIHQSRKKYEKNDSVIDSKIKVHSLGYEGKRWDRIDRIKRIKRICKNVSKDYDILLIRGITPRQFTIYTSCNTPVKTFLFVGSLIDSIPPFANIFRDPYAYIFHFIRKLELKLISSKATIFANSHTSVNEIEKYFSTKSYFVSTNTISEKILSNSFIKEESEKIKLIFCGRIVKDKGIIELLDAFNILLRENNKFELHLIGNLSENFKQEIYGLSFWNSIKDQIVFHGFVPFGNDLFQILRNGSMLILPSYHEGFPHIIWESAVVGLPVIVTDVGGIKGLVSEKDVEFIKSKSSIDIVRAVNYTQDNPRLAKERIDHLKKTFFNYSLESGTLSLFKKINNLFYE